MEGSDEDETRGLIHFAQDLYQYLQDSDCNAIKRTFRHFWRHLARLPESGPFPRGVAFVFALFSEWVVSLRPDAPYLHDDEAYAFGRTDKDYTFFMRRHAKTAARLLAIAKEPFPEEAEFCRTALEERVPYLVDSDVEVSSDEEPPRLLDINNLKKNKTSHFLLVTLPAQCHKEKKKK